MEKNRGDCCDKFLNTICCVQSQQRGSSPPTTASNSKNAEAAGVVSIEYDYASKSQQKDGQQHQIPPGKTAPRQGNEQALHGEIQGEFANIEQPQGSQETGKKTEHHIEDRFADYINRAKIKIRTMSNVGDHHGKSSAVEKNHPHGGKESKEHHFLDYIKRAGKKIRSTTSMKDRAES